MAKKGRVKKGEVLTVLLCAMFLEKKEMGLGRRSKVPALFSYAIFRNAPQLKASGVKDKMQNLLRACYTMLAFYQYTGISFHI